MLRYRRITCRGPKRGGLRVCGARSKRVSLSNFRAPWRAQALTSTAVRCSRGGIHLGHSPSPGGTARTDLLTVAGVTPAPRPLALRLNSWFPVNSGTPE